MQMVPAVITLAYWVIVALLCFLHHKGRIEANLGATLSLFGAMGVLIAGALTLTFYQTIWLWVAEVIVVGIALMVHSELTLRRLRHQAEPA